MIREDRFLISRKPYAVDLASFRQTERDPDKTWAWYTIDAVWFRRRRGETVACIGSLRDIIDDPKPLTAQDFLHRFTDGRYGGDCHGRWDGSSYWGDVTLDTQRQHLEVLQPMLANYPAIPPGYDGWWTFHTP
ncbi:hypothetical protein [Streptomyces sp. NPDC003395]